MNLGWTYEKLNTLRVPSMDLKCNGINYAIVNMEGEQMLVHWRRGKRVWVSSSSILTDKRKIREIVCVFDDLNM